ncbi:cyclic peptide export ABC transporter [Paraburkholderia bonniea]|uniref:cyclic peptide export ABC transporter n=1 Tax=Paraburkholderia bonniea TaxID=2152891 RepID=UPI002572BB35|nr:cyclic peptide export ABC transporter [Paraburkholderia bonniea]WJF91895.1 cyclic peptide export ABC transporter [Paraburkholderia bonniea]WJF95214.1 cyclic peptide export ABC transporter [Paraburkholderia bonniea]
MTATSAPPRPANPERPATRLLLTLLRRSRGTLALALMACVANGASSVLLVATLNQALSAPSAANSSLALRFAACAVIALLARILSGVLFAGLSQDTMSQMRRHAAERVAAAELRDVERVGAAPVQSILTDDATNVSMLFFALPNIVMHGSIVVGCLAYLAWLSWPVCLLALSAIVIGSLGYRLGDIRALAALEAAGHAQDRLFGYLGSLFAGAKELKLHRARAAQFVDGQLGAAIAEVRDHRRRAFIAYAVGVGWIVFLFYVFLGLATFWPTMGTHASPQAAASYVIVFLFLLIPLDGLLNNLPTVNAARVSLERIETVLAEFDPPALAASAASVTSATSTVTSGPTHGSNSSNSRTNSAAEVTRSAEFSTLTLRGVTHAYFHERDERMFRIGPINLTFKPGELVFIVGGNGSGKTTLAKVITGLYEPEEGVIEVDGITLPASGRAQYRERFSTVFNDFHLFDALLGIVDPTEASRASADARANALLAQLALEHKVQVVDGRFSTRALSTGQRKRLALVVAYLEDRPFYLFDEWAADQDPAFKAVFYEQLLPELRARGKTVVVVTHDDRYFTLADRVLKLDNGTIVNETRGMPHSLTPQGSAPPAYQSAPSSRQH